MNILGVSFILYVLENEKQKNWEPFKNLLNTLFFFYPKC